MAWPFEERNLRRMTSLKQNIAFAWPQRDNADFLKKGFKLQM